LEAGHSPEILENCYGGSESSLGHEYLSSLTALNENNLFGPLEVAVPETHSRFQPNSVWQCYSKFCQIFFCIYFLNSVSKILVFIATAITSDTSLLYQPHTQTINAFMLYFL